MVHPEKELFGFSLNFNIHVSVSNLYIPTISLPVLLTDTMNEEIATEATQFLF